MATLVVYGSSDEEDNIQPERPAKVAKIEHTTSQNPIAPTNSETSASIASSIPQTAEPTQSQAAPSGPAPGPSIPGPADESADAPAPAPSSGTPTAHDYERQRLRELTMPTVPNFDIPDAPEPPPTNSEEAAVLAASTKKFEKFLELKKKGVHFNERLQNSSSLRNPSLLLKLMDFAGISQEDSYAAALPEALALPTKWPEDCYVESLLKQNERREKKRVAERDKVEFVSAAKSVPSSTASTPAEREPPQKRSRFDR